MASRVTLNGELMFPNDYLNAIEFKGKDVKLTISAVSKEMLKKKSGQNKAEMVIRFNRTPKKLVCNKTNADAIANLYGPEAKAWVGKEVTLYPTRCLAFGDMVDCIRVRESTNGHRSQPGRNDAPPGDSSDILDEMQGDQGLPVSDEDEVEQLRQIQESKRRSSPSAPPADSGSESEQSSPQEPAGASDSQVADEPSLDQQERYAAKYREAEEAAHAAGLTAPAFTAGFKRWLKALKVTDPMNINDAQWTAGIEAIKERRGVFA